jgi:peptidoglycan/LPS O-acetylase OafA/YrhL
MTSAQAAVLVPRRFAALDGMRALAAYGVLATHAGFNSGRSLDSGPFAPLLARLDFGVTVFFLLSGFLLYRPFAASALAGTAMPSVRRFYLRRGLRILPAYWLAVLVTLSWLSNRTADRGDYASYLLLIQTYNHHNLDPSLTQMWTLAVEISFYAVLPPLALLARGRGGESAVRRQLALLAGLVAVAVGSNLLAHRGAATSLESLIWLPANLDWFAAGMALALLSCLPSTAASAGEGPAGTDPVSTGPITALTARTARLARELATAPGTCWVIGGLLFWLASLPLGGPRNLLVPTGWEWTIKHWLYALAALALLLPLTLGSGGLLGRLLSSPVMQLLGQLSYGVYLWHLPLLLAIQRGLGQHTFGGHFTELFVLTALAATGVAALSWFGMERRLLRLGSSWFRPGGDSQQAAAASSTAMPHPS